ncbi:hypothetical protein [Kitasatospora sp. A2-31]|uniref:hypothetical protein n=1 Tax=Kitasatospora sp. A2-31 TaxID=2916414 RepID=UPI001EEA9183|nr:hypothetical protein [Kitasatospora sp. A2-31]MCG6497139.1 hypothetical protein [Kitasatospora sp. A2-31]
MTVTWYDHEPAAGDPLPGSPAATPSRQAAETTAAPVFVDSSGRRQRRVRRLGLLLAVPAAGYLVLVASTVLGGPSVSAPFLPLPPAPSAAPTAPAAETPSEVPTIPGAPGPDSVQPGPAQSAVAGRRGAPTAAGRSATPEPSAPPSAGPSGSATPGGNGNGNGNGGNPTVTPGHGRPTDAPGHSGNGGGKTAKPSPAP